MRAPYATANGQTCSTEELKKVRAELHEAARSLGFPRNGIRIENGVARPLTDAEAARNRASLTRYEQQKAQRKLETQRAILSHKRAHLAEYSKPTRDPRILRERLENKLNR